MFALPSVADIVSVASLFGINLSEDDAESYRDFIVDRLAAIDAFVQSRLEEDRPPLLFPERAPGYRPLAAEDPHNAWLWKCRIGGGDGLLAGKTVSFKDHVAVAGIPLTFGSYALEGFIPDFDATVATRVLTAGGTIIGKNTMVGFTGGRGLVYGYLGDYGDPVNPHDSRRSPGGSSSGCAAALAAGEVDIAFGGDQGGSIRIPSAYCGLVGLKPTFGLVSHMGISHGADPSIDHVGPMARRVEDVAAALQAVAGYDGYDPRQGRDVPEGIDALTGLADGVAGLRIGVLSEGFGEGLDSEVRDGVLEAVDALARAGAKVTKVDVPEHGEIGVPAGVLMDEGYRAMRLNGLFGLGARTFYPASVIAAVNRMWDGHADHLKTYYKVNFVLAELSRRNFHGAAYAKAQNVRPAFVRAYDRALAEVDMLAMPTCPTVAPELPADVGPIEGWRRQIDVLKSLDVKSTMRNMLPFDYTGHPALAVPCGRSDGLPFSLQLVGRYYEDPLLLRAAHAYQDSVDWETQGAPSSPRR